MEQSQKSGWEQFCAKAKKTASTVVKKTGEMADLASMQLKLKKLESKRDEQYKNLGRSTYRQLKTGESLAEKIAPVLDDLDDLRAKIRVQVEKIEAAKAARQAEKAFKKHDAEDLTGNATDSAEEETAE